MKGSHFDLLERTRGEYLDKARTEARKLLKHRDYITIDDIRKVCPPPDDVDPRVMGAVFHSKDFESIGWIRSDRVECHRRPIQRFRLVHSEPKTDVRSLIFFRRRNKLAEDIA